MIIAPIHATPLAPAPPAPVPPKPLPPTSPSALAIKQFGADLTALGATTVRATSPTTVEAVFATAPAWVIADTLVNDTLAGAKIVMRGPLTGKPFLPTVDLLAAAAGKLAGVQSAKVVRAMPKSPGYIKMDVHPDSMLRLKDLLVNTARTNAGVHAIRLIPFKPVPPTKP